MSKLLSSVPVDETTAHVINLVRSGAAATRPELVRLIGVGRAAINERVEQALRAGVLVDGEMGASTGGRAPRQLRFGASTGTLHAIDLGTSHIAVAVTDLTGDLLGQTSLPWDTKSGPEDTLTRATDLLAKLRKDLKLPEQAWGIGVGLPGPVDFASAKPVVGAPLLPGWDNFDIRGWFEEKTSSPVWADNDLNLLLLGMWNRTHHPEGDPEGDIILVKISNGVGASILSEGLIHRGRNGSAGDIGHSAVRSDAGVRCRCGQNDCLESLAGGWALARDGKLAAADGGSEFLSRRLAERGDLSAFDIAEGLSQSDPVCIDLLVRSASYVGETLANLVSFFNPATIYLAGILPELGGDLYLITVRRAVYQRALPLATRDLRIVTTTIDHEDALRSAAMLVADQIFDPRRLPLWLAEGHPGAVENLAAVSR